MDVEVDFEPMSLGFESRESHIFLWFINLFIYFMFFLVIFITVQICKFNITVSTQFLLLYYSLWCPGLQRLQRFDLIMHLSNTHDYFQHLELKLWNMIDWIHKLEKPSFISYSRMNFDEVWIIARLNITVCVVNMEASFASLSKAFKTTETAGVWTITV